MTRVALVDEADADEEEAAVEVEKAEIEPILFMICNGPGAASTNKPASLLPC